MSSLPSSSSPPQPGPERASPDAGGARAPRATASAPVPLPLPSHLFVPLPPGSETLTLPAGTHVAAGEPLLTSTAGAAHVPLAPVAGVVRGVTRVQLLGTGDAPALEIEVGASDAAAKPQAAGDAHLTPTASLGTLIDRVRAAGVHASRSTSPDLLAQLHEAVRRPVDTVLCSLLDASGGSALSAVVLRTAGREMLAGIDALATASGANRVWLVADSGIFNRASALVRKVTAASANGTPRVKVIELTNEYPQADPTLMLYALLGRRLRPGRLPPEVNALLIDGAAAAAIGRAATRGEPMLEVPVEVRESARSRSTIYTAAVGLPVRYLLDACGLRAAGDLTLRAGAALRDVRVSCDAVVDGGGELTIDAGPTVPPINPDPCIRCGWCVEACPVRIHPAGLLEAAQDHDPAAADRFGLHACIECGICSYVCPSRLPLLPAIRGLKGDRR